MPSKISRNHLQKPVNEFIRYTFNETNEMQRHI